METVIKQEPELDIVDVPPYCESDNLPGNVVPLINIKNEPCDDLEVATVVSVTAYHCNLCNKTFDTSVTPHSHIRQQKPNNGTTDVLPLVDVDVRPKRDRTGIEILSILCNICNRGFISSKDFKEHASELHQLTFAESQLSTITTLERKETVAFQVKKCKTDKTYVRPAKKVKVSLDQAESSKELHQTLQETTVKQEPELDIVDELAPCESEKLEVKEESSELVSGDTKDLDVHSQNTQQELTTVKQEPHSTDPPPVVGAKVKIKGPGPPPPCKLCHKTLNSWAAVDKHSLAHQKTLAMFEELRKTEDVVLCEVCYTVQRFKSYDIHLYACRRINKFNGTTKVPKTKCDICSKTFWGKILLERHLNLQSCSKDKPPKIKTTNKPNVNELVNKLLAPHRKKKR